MMVFGAVAGFVIAWILAILMILASHVFVGLAVYYDAQSKMNENATMWGVLCGLLGLIPCIIYLCVRNSPSTRPIVCQSCGWTHPLSSPVCPHCSQQNPFANMSQQNAMAPYQKKRAKTFLTVGIVLIAVAILVAIVAVCLFVGAMVSYPGGTAPHYYY